MLLVATTSSPHNYWELGTPNKQRYQCTPIRRRQRLGHRPPSNSIVTGTRGNVSYLYSPIINISQIKADTLSFRLRRKLTNGSSLRLEFYNYEGTSGSTPRRRLLPLNWYNNRTTTCFDNTTSGTSYNRY